MFRRLSNDDIHMVLAELISSYCCGEKFRAKNPVLVYNDETGKLSIEDITEVDETKQLVVSSQLDSTEGLAQLFEERQCAPPSEEDATWFRGVVHDWFG